MYKRMIVNREMCGGRRAWHSSILQHLPVGTEEDDEIPHSEFSDCGS
jgi:hypothetical protein